VSAPPPWDRGPLDEPGVDPSARRRRAWTAAAVIAASVVLAVIVFVAAGWSGGGKTSLTPLGTPTTSAASTTTSSTAAAATGAPPVAPIHVDVVVGLAVIAGHMSCSHEDPLTGDSLADVEAAVAADNDGAGPYAHNAAAQSEIVRASMQQLHGTHRFYADCRPATTSASSPSASADTPAEPGGSTSAEPDGSPSAATLPPSR
jgi:hypothetical protein